MDRKSVDTQLNLVGLFSNLKITIFHSYLLDGICETNLIFDSKMNDYLNHFGTLFSEQHPALKIF